MFNTFTANERQKGNENQSRPRRAQVNRACDWCRLNRIKCDTDKPCRNCRETGHDCTNNNANEFRSVAAATSEVEKLRRQVRELKSQLEASPTHASMIPCPIDGTGPSVSPSHVTSSRQWPGVYLTDPLGQKSQLYGPSSQIYFMHRMTTYVASSLGRPKLDLYDHAHRVSEIVLDNGAMGYHLPHDFLDMEQQNSFIDLFWEGYHACLPIIHEQAFRDHYDSLWSGSSRRPSHIVEIILAICIQWGTATLPRSDSENSRIEDDPSLAGRSYYRRCIHLLRADMDQPTMETVQSYVFAMIYLWNANLVNSAQALAAKAIRIATIIGLDREPPADLPSLEKDIRRRLWWTLRSKDGELGTELGRPSLAVSTPVLCSFPCSDNLTAEALGPTYKSPTPDITWLTYVKEWMSLVSFSQPMISAFETECNQILGESQADDIYGDDKAREECARRFVTIVEPLEKWEKTLPSGLKTARRDGQPFSTDRSPIAIDPSVPLWLQRQRILLELKYHHVAMILFRQFMFFASMPSSTTPTADDHVRRSLSHAIAITRIMHQTLRETDILNVWYHALRIQQDAMLTMAGFLVAYPMCVPVVSARKAMVLAIEVFEIYGESIAAGSYAADLARKLKSDAEYIIGRFRSTIAAAPSDDAPKPETISSNFMTEQSSIAPSVALSEDTFVTASEAMDIEPLWPAGMDFSVPMWDGQMARLDIE